MHRSPRDGLRGRIVQFGTDVTKRFCERNALRMIIRSHQWEREGFRFMHGGRLLTVFSARDYDQSRCDDGLARNHGARARARAYAWRVGAFGAGGRRKRAAPRAMPGLPLTRPLPRLAQGAIIFIVFDETGGDSVPNDVCRMCQPKPRTMLRVKAKVLKCFGAN